MSEPLSTKVSFQSSNPTSLNSPQLHNNEAIFTDLLRKVCLVVWEIGQDSPIETTGCFVKLLGSERLQIVTCFHEKLWAGATIHIKTIAGLFSCAIQQGMSVDLAKKHDLCILEIVKPSAELESMSGFFQISNDVKPLSLGSKVYFAGYPLTQMQPLVHKGYISSVDNQNAFFTIDGTIVSGNSGGPVAIKDNNALILVGIISSQIVDMTKQLMKSSATEVPKFFPSNASIPKVGNMTMHTVLKDFMENFLKNVSTGIGKANRTSKIWEITQRDKDETTTANSVQISFLQVAKQISRSEQKTTNGDPIISLTRTQLEELKKLKKSESSTSTSLSIPIVSQSITDLPTARKKREDLIADLKNCNYQYEGPGKGSHEIWSNGNGYRVSVPHGSEIALGTANSIIEQANEHPGNPNGHLITTSTSTSTSTPTNIESQTMKKGDLDKGLESFGWKVDPQQQEGNKELWVNGKGKTQYVPISTDIKVDAAKLILKKAKENPGDQ